MRTLTLILMCLSLFGASEEACASVGRLPPPPTVFASEDGQFYVKYVPESETIAATLGTATVYQVLRDSCDRELWRVVIPLNRFLYLSSSGEYLLVLNGATEEWSDFAIECYHKGEFAWGITVEEMITDFDLYEKQWVRVIPPYKRWLFFDLRPHLSMGYFYVTTLEKLEYKISIYNGVIIQKVHKQ